MLFRVLRGQTFLTSIGATAVVDCAMGDKSPKANQKQAKQKQAENNASNKQKQQAAAAKQQPGNNPKRGK